MSESKDLKEVFKKMSAEQQKAFLNLIAQELKRRKGKTKAKS